MTGGRVVVLGPTGRNFGAGMSGGMAYIYDPQRRFGRQFNPELVDVEALNAEDEEWVFGIVVRHREETGSAVADRILRNWRHSARDLVKVMPRDYRRVLEATERAQAEGRSVDDAVMAAAHG
jgi:glutamate synthase (NADPH/NADH) large chain